MIFLTKVEARYEHHQLSFDLADVFVLIDSKEIYSHVHL